ncbi:Pentatricopeptide repeat-containing protein, chloroplastic [Symbiodinium microadriaticum]|uniref:Pentatricopeptide repeat-containing protein, chloroplastic n=1 Tax=Symbiodinium microadriaticum TaxID=2951 RepID=A0A1Q9EG01_SYMMI|nr:Pentatricopeptide repeat-containing protein, chloroplastic [Symbiodinium microadriaticum]
MMAVKKLSGDLSAISAARRALRRIKGLGAEPQFKEVGDALPEALRRRASDPKLGTWLLARLGGSGFTNAAFELLHVLQNLRLEGNVYHYSSVLTACEKGSAWANALNLANDMALVAVRSNQLSFGALISSAEKSGLWSWALHLLREMRSTWLVPDAISYSAGISACEKGCQWRDALTKLELMPVFGQMPNILSYSGAISACEKAGGNLWSLALGLSALLPERDVVSQSAVISAVEKAAKWGLALSLLEEMSLASVVANLVSFNAASSACDRRCCWQAACRLFHSLSSKTQKADLLSYNVVISACSVGRPRDALQLFMAMASRKLLPDVTTFAAAERACGASDEQAIPEVLQTMERWQIRLFRTRFRIFHAQNRRGGERKFFVFRQVAGCAVKMSTEFHHALVLVLQMSE